MFDALKEAKKTKNIEVVAVRKECDAKIKAYQHELKELQKKCKQLVLYLYCTVQFLVSTSFQL